MHGLPEQPPPLPGHSVWALYYRRGLRSRKLKDHTFPDSVIWARGQFGSLLISINFEAASNAMFCVLSLRTRLVAFL